MTRRLLLAALASAGVLLAAAPADPTPPPEAPLRVLAASSLTETLTAVGAAWAAQGHPPISLTFDASSRLAKQIEAGAPADLFLSADSNWMDFLASKALIDPASRVDLLGNTLVAVVPADRALALSSARDLTRPEVQRLALAGAAVPAGWYALSALQSLGVWDAVYPRVVNGDNVRAVLGWVARGEADVGVVYATDARVEPRVQIAFAFPASSHPPIVYPGAVVAGSASAAQATSFLRYCQGPEAMAIFRAAGFLPPPR